MATVPVDDQNPLFSIAKYVQDLKDGLAESEQELEEVGQQISSKSKELQDLNDLLSKKTQEFDDLNQRFSKQTDELNSVYQKINSLNTQISDLDSQLASVKEQLRIALRPEWEVKADKVLDVAMKYYNQHMESGQSKFPYDFGANPTLGSDGTVVSGTFDCSSYTKQCYNEGIQLVIPRKSVDQATRGSAVTTPRKGDEVFFNTNLDANKIVDHCGIMIDDDQFIHSNPSGKGINIKRLSDPWGKKYFLFARRLF